MPDPDKGGRDETLREAFARHEGSVTAEIRNIAHDIKGLQQSLGAYATTRDLKVVEEKVMASASVSSVMAVVERVAKLENSQTWVVRAILGAVVSGAIGAIVTGTIALAKMGAL